MNILLVGGTGYLGKALASKLSEAHHSVIVSSRRPQPNLVHLDLTNSSDALRTIDRVNPEIVFNFSWNTHGQDYLSSSLNFDSLAWNLKLFKVLRSSSAKKIISVGTSAENDTGVIPSSGKGFSPYSSLYAATKRIACSVFFEEFQDATQLPYWARVFQVYGGTQPKSKFIPTLLAHTKKQSVFHLENPTCKLDWIHVEDVADALIAIMHNPVEPLIDIGIGKGISNLDICKFMTKFGLTFVSSRPAERIEPLVQFANIESALFKYFRPKFDLFDYLEEAMR